MADTRVFPMSTFVTTLKGGDASDSSVIELLGYVTQSPVTGDFVPFAAALSKAWIYEQSPDLAKISGGDIAAKGQKVAIAPMAEDQLAQAKDVLDKLAELKKTIDDQAAQIKELEGKLGDATSKLNVADAKVKTFESAAAKGEQKINVSEKKVDEYIGKVKELLDEIEKVKKEGVVVAGAAGGGGEAGAAADDGGGAPSAEAGEDFGLSGGGSDPFSDSGW